MNLPLNEAMNYRYNNPEGNVSVDKQIVEIYTKNMISLISELHSDLEVMENLFANIERMKLWASMSNEKNLVEILETRLVRNQLLGKEQQLVK